MGCSFSSEDTHICDYCGLLLNGIHVKFLNRDIEISLGYNFEPDAYKELVEEISDSYEHDISNVHHLMVNNLKKKLSDSYVCSTPCIIEFCDSYGQVIDSCELCYRYSILHECRFRNRPCCICSKCQWNISAVK